MISIVYSSIKGVEWNMKRLKTFILLKKFFSTTKSETYILISGGLTGFFIIFILNALLGLYSIFGTSNDLSENFTGINLARNAQVALYEQVSAWDNILISGGRYTEFQKNFHEFSKKSERVQNILFNLKLQNSGESKILDDIEKLREMHKKMTLEFTYHIADMENSSFKNVHEKINVTKGMENELLDSLTDIASRIEKAGNKQSLFISSRYIVIAVVSTIIFIMLLIYYGKQIGRRLLKTHSILEDMVQERTREYVEANFSLKKEIEEHKITEQKLILSKNEIEDKNQLLSVSEKKYRQIVEGTTDIIFTLDENWYFKTANDAVKTHLKISPEAVARFRLTDLVCDELTDATILRKIVTEKLEESRKENKALKFNAQLKTPNLIEPVEFRISLEFIEIDGNSEIIGKAVRLSDDSFSESFISEKCEYLIKNLLFEADDISHRITNNLQKYIDKNDINMLRIGLREVIINSIEHGNLNISFDEKTEATLSDRYFEFINERQAHSEYRDKRVRIEYLISPGKAVYKITDQGRGFNHRKYLAGISSESEDPGLMHGRGITMVKSIFDEVRYNSRGNQVLLVKNIKILKGQENNGNDIEFRELQHTEVS